MDASAAVPRPAETPLLAGSASGTGRSTGLVSTVAARLLQRTHLVQGKEDDLHVQQDAVSDGNCSDEYQSCAGNSSDEYLSCASCDSNFCHCADRTSDEVSTEDGELSIPEEQEVLEEQEDNLFPSSSLSNPFSNRSACPAPASFRMSYSFPHGDAVVLPSTPSTFAQFSPDGAEASSPPGSTYPWNPYPPQSDSPEHGAAVVSPPTPSLSPQTLSGTASPPGPSCFSLQGVIMSPPTLSNSQSTPRKTHPSPITFLDEAPYDNALQINEPCVNDLTPGVHVQSPGQQQPSFLAGYPVPDVYETRTENFGLRISEQLHIQDEKCEPAGASTVQDQPTTGAIQSKGATEGNDGEGNCKQLTGTEGVAASSRDEDSIHIIGGPQQEEVQNGNDEETINLRAAIRLEIEKQLQRLVSAAGTVATPPAIEQRTVVPIQWPAEHCGVNRNIYMYKDLTMKRFTGEKPSEQHEEAERWLKDLGCAVVERWWNYNGSFECVHRYLHGQARAWYCNNEESFLFHEQGSAAGWQEFWTAFEAKYVRKDERELQEEFERRVQKEGESIEDYVAAVVELAKGLGYHVDDARVKFQIFKGALILHPSTSAELETVLSADDTLQKVDEYQAHDGFIEKAISTSENVDKKFPEKDEARKQKTVPEVRESQAGKQTTLREASASTLAGTSSSSGQDTLPNEGNPVHQHLTQKNHLGDVLVFGDFTPSDAIPFGAFKPSECYHLRENNTAPQPEAALPEQGPLPGKATEEEEVEALLRACFTTELPPDEPALLQQEQIPPPHYSGKQRIRWYHKR